MARNFTLMNSVVLDKTLQNVSSDQFQHYMNYRKMNE